jgi:hypothetical protein
MVGIGLTELLLLPVAILYIGLPIATFVLVLKVHGKVKRIENTLGVYARGGQR